MKLRIDTKDLQRIVTAASLALPRRSPGGILNSMRLEAIDNRLIATATDIELYLKVHSAAQVDTPGGTIVAGKDLASLVSRLPDGEITLEQVATKLRITYPGGNASLPVGTETYPSPPSPGQEMLHITLSADRFREAVKAVAPIASRDESRPILTGINFKITNRDIQFTTTDGFRVACIREYFDLSGDVSITVPTTLITKAMAAGMSGDLSLIVGDRAVILSGGTVEAVVRLLDGKYPDVLQIIPKDFPIRAITDSAALSDAIKRTELAGDPRQRLGVRMTLKGDNLIVSASNNNYEIEELISAEISGADEFCIRLNPFFMQDGLTFINDERVLLEFSGQLTAARITSVNQKEWFYLLMPMREEEA
jgi:DNA polymerase-3 subunit beta